MKRLLLCALLLSALHTKAQDHGLGVGLMVGDPTGLSAKYWIAGERALDFGLAWGLWRGGYVHLHADYLFHNMNLITVSKGKLPLYYGPGLRIRSWGANGYWHRGRYEEGGGGHIDLGIRFPVGSAYLIDGAPVDVFFELVPTLDLVPATSVDLDFALGARYWFN
ncbi:MAG: hypothetical protein IPI72_03005 [Flavobacteriales bacterium]|nr:hypothetical protein [Flavobacteriales bacterium]MBP8879041.1 hypothetical protein [Flavobacteriales bacterium]